MQNSPAHPSASAPAPTHRPEPVVQSQPSYRRPSKQEKSYKKFYIGGAIGLVVIILVILAVIITQSLSPKGAIDSSKYQAVFLTNGNQYFGKLKQIDSETMSLSHVFYLERKASDDTEDTKKSTDPADDVQLIKRGNEIHGPEDEMIIDRRQILFFENLKPQGKVSKAITDYKQ